MNDDRRNSLEGHDGINPLLGKRSSNTRLVPVPRDEDQVPDLEKAIAILAVRPTVRPHTAVLLAPVVVALGVRSTRPGGTRGPEVVLITKAPNPLGRDAGLLPDLEALVIVVVDPGPQPLLFELQVFGQEFVRVGNGLLLEVVAKGEVPQHLEKGEVMAIVPYHVDVDRAEDLLTGGGTRVRRISLAQKVRFELDHAGAGEQQGRIAERDQGGARQHLVVPLFEEVEKTLADVRARHIWPARLVIVLSSNSVGSALDGRFSSRRASRASAARPRRAAAARHASGRCQAAWRLPPAAARRRSGGT